MRPSDSRNPALRTNDPLVWPSQGESSDAMPTGPRYRRDVTPAGTGIEANQAAPLKAGNLLLVYRDTCWLVDAANESVTRLFVIRRPHDFTLWRAIPDKDGYIYCAASGSVSTPSSLQPIPHVEFGKWGEVFRVRMRDRTIETIAELTDSIEIEFVDESQAIVADFNNWGGTGQIYLLNRHVGNMTTLVDGGLVTEPYGVHRDDDGVLWIANAFGLEYDAQIIRVDPDGNQSVVRRKQGLYSGVTTSLYPSPNRRKLLGIIVDWPYMAKSALFEFDKDTQDMQTILGASPEAPSVFTPGCAFQGETLWVAESYRNELLQIDLTSNGQDKVISRIDISAVRGADLGIMHAWDFIEAVAIVPEGWPG